MKLKPDRKYVANRVMVEVQALMRRELKAGSYRTCGLRSSRK